MTCNDVASTSLPIIGQSKKFLQVLKTAQVAAASSANIVLYGESGTGKEMLAKYIHKQSKVRSGPLVSVNCSAIPENLLESELFGHVRGAFTGAHNHKIGLFEEAQNGTLFLDEIGDLSLQLQSKLLRVLQERVIRRVGDTKVRPVNCRIISATHKDLYQEVRAKNFREDLLFRINVIPITLPPLREHKEDILLLTQEFLKKFSVLNGSPLKSLSDESTYYILNNPWRGNVRELENAIERAVVLCPESVISTEYFKSNSQSEESSQLESQTCAHTFTVHYDQDLPMLDEVVQKYIDFAVKTNLGAKDKTAKDIGIDRKTLYKRLRNPNLFSDTRNRI